MTIVYSVCVYLGNFAARALLGPLSGERARVEINNFPTLRFVFSALARAREFTMRGCVIISFNSDSV